MSNVVQLGAKKNLDAKAMLLEAASEADQYEDVVIICRKKDNSVQKWATSISPWFLYGCSSLLSDLANKSLNGEIETEY